MLFCLLNDICSWAINDGCLCRINALIKRSPAPCGQALYPCFSHPNFNTTFNLRFCCRTLFLLKQQTLNPIFSRNRHWKMQHKLRRSFFSYKDHFMTLIHQLSGEIPSSPTHTLSVSFCSYRVDRKTEIKIILLTRARKSQATTEAITKHCIRIIGVFFSCWQLNCCEGVKKKKSAHII